MPLEDLGANQKANLNASLREEMEQKAGDPNLQKKFWGKVIKTNDCWEWKGFRTKRGYGVFYFNWGQCIASRMAFAITNGPIPKGLMVCHKCDNPPCCNPSHLFLGTHEENQKDKANKKRSAASVHPKKYRGEMNGFSILQKHEVLEIRSLHSSGSLKMPAIAKRYNVSYHAVYDIIRRKNWKHI